MCENGASGLGFINASIKSAAYIEARSAEDINGIVV